MRLLIIQQCLVSNIFDFMIDCYLRVNGAGDTFRCVSPILLFLKVAKVKCPPARKENLKVGDSYRINKIRLYAMQWAESSHHHM